MKLDPRATAAGVRLVAHEVLGSTNAEALSLARQGERGPLWVVAERQTAGRGRRGRTWISQPGNLYASLLLTDPAPPEHWPELSFVAALAVHDAVVEVAPDLKPRLAIKWPNDLLLAGREVRRHPDRRREPGRPGASRSASASIARAIPPASDYPATDLAAAGAAVSPAALFAALSVKMLGRSRNGTAGEGFSTIRADWLARAAGLGEDVRVRLADRELIGRFETHRRGRRPGAALARRQRPRPSRPAMSFIAAGAAPPARRADRTRMMARPSDELVFAPLGGVGEIGMNLALYGLGDEHRRQWIAVDLGVAFAGDELPGVDLILPDIRYLVEERRNILGIVLTHAHEDHFGALLDLWPQLKIPVYATPFTAALLQAKRESEPGAPEIPVNIVPLGGRFALGPFDIELVSMAHSIPESNGLIIRTPLGTVLHTGDWKIDPTPVIGPPTDEAKLRALGDEGCLALIGDSTNAVREGRSPSEADVAKCLAELIRTAPARVAVTTFASNVARMRAVARSRRRLRARSRPGRPRHGAHLAGRARDRLSRRHPGISLGRYLRPSAAGQGGGALHRQPGRAARGAVAHRPGRSSRGRLFARRPRDLFLARHSRQREGGDAGDQRPGRAGHRGDHRSHPSRACLRPSAAGRARGHDRLGAAANPASRCMASRCTWPSMPRSRAAPASARWCCAATATWCGWRPAAPERSTRCRRDGSTRTARSWSAPRSARSPIAAGSALPGSFRSRSRSASAASWSAIRRSTLTGIPEADALGHKIERHRL